MIDLRDERPLDFGAALRLRHRSWVSGILCKQGKGTLFEEKSRPASQGGENTQTPILESN